MEGRSSWTRHGHACGVRVQRVQKVQRVQRGGLTGLRPEGCGRLSAAGCVRFAQGATAPAALRVADCRSAAMLIKSALRNLLSVSYGMKTILLIGSLRSPPPIRLRWTSPLESVSHDSQVASLPYSTAITDSQYFARHCVPSKYVRWCDSCSLATPSGGQNQSLYAFL